MLQIPRMPELGIQCFPDRCYRWRGRSGQGYGSGKSSRRPSQGTGRRRKGQEPRYNSLSRVKRKIRVHAAKLLAEMSGDQLAVKTPILNEYLTGLRSGDDHSGNVDSRNIRFQVLRIADRTKLFRRKFDAHAAEEIEVGMIPSKREHKIVFQIKSSKRSSQREKAPSVFLHCGCEVADDLGRLYGVFDGGTPPVLDVAVNL